ncbi:hypothetical protein JCM10207_003528 [Rhodosporidiobolus poonsookiae]
MSSRPSRTTRASAAAASTAPAATARTTRSSVAPQPTSSRTTRSSRSTTPAPVLEVTKPAATRASTARASTAQGGGGMTRASTSTNNKPTWNSRIVPAASSSTTASHTRAETPPAKRASSLAVQGSSLKPKTPGLLSRMTSRESLRPAPKTPAPSQREREAMEAYDGAREPIKAYLRIRPAPTGVPLQSYIQVLNPTDVLMVPPLDHRLNPSSSSSSIYSNALLRNTSSQRLSTLNLDPSSHPSGVPPDVLASPTPYSHGRTQEQQPDPSTFGSLYKFTGVFPSSSPSAPTSPTSPSISTSSDASSQSAFFRSTALPLVRAFLEKGENCLLFAYGPSGSGKTFTVQGGQGDEAGLLPRIVEVVCGSLEGKTKPASPTAASYPAAGRRVTSQPLQSTPVKPSLRGLGARDSRPMVDLPELVPVQEGYEYAVYVSYSEIYNEKIYDLLESPLPAPAPSTSSTTSTTGGGMLKGLFKNLTTVKRSALSLKADKPAPQQGVGAGAKVVGGLREVRVMNAEDAHKVLHQGQSNRRVFSTLANRASSRSHSIFTLKLVRVPLGLSASQTAEHTVVSKFSVVDLAGSERVVNTQTTGERLKEAGSINKSLMVLGQCMEVLRKNQERGEGRKPAIVPFRHSKLTEMFQSFFTGQGKAVMIVNINPYSTSFDENSHVMKFSAVARGVMTVQRNGNALVLPPPAAPAKQAEEVVKEVARVKKEPRVVRLSLIDGGEEEEVLYEEDDYDEDDSDDDEFVNALLDELSALRTALFESQMSAVLAEANTRARVVKEYEGKMLDMERHYQARMREEAIEAEHKLNAKLDILTRLQAAKTPARTPYVSRAPSLTPSTVYDDSDEDEEDGEEDGSENDASQVEKMLLAGNDSIGSMSPLAARVKVHVTASPSPAPLLAASSAPKAPSPLGQSTTSRAENESAPPPAAVEAEDEQDAEASIVEHEEADEDAGNDSRFTLGTATEDADLSRRTQQTEDGEDDGAEQNGDADLSRLTELTEEDGDVSGEVVDLRRLTAQYGDEEESERSRNEYIEDEAEGDDYDEGEEEEEEDELDAGEEEASDGDAYGSDDAAEDEGSGDDFEPSPVPSPSKATAASAKKTSPVKAVPRQSEPAEDESFDTFSPTQTPAHSGSIRPVSAASRDKENAPVSTPVQGGGEDDFDEFALDKSMVIRSGTKSKKSKRKLGAKVVDAEDLDTYAEGILSPIRKTSSIRSFSHY